MSNKICGQAQNLPTDYVQNSKNMSNIVWGPAQDRPLRSADLAEK